MLVCHVAQAQLTAALVAHREAPLFNFQRQLFREEAAGTRAARDEEDTLKPRIHRPALTLSQKAGAPVPEGERAGAQDRAELGARADKVARLRKEVTAMEGKIAIGYELMHSAAEVLVSVMQHSIEASRPEGYRRSTTDYRRMKRLRQAALMSLFAGNEEMEEYYRDYSGKGCAQCRRGSGPEGCQCVSVDGGGWGGGGVARGTVFKFHAHGHGVFLLIPMQSPPPPCPAS